jgi:hypothetical protein
VLNIKFASEVVQRFGCGCESEEERVRLQKVFLGGGFGRALVGLNWFAEAPRQTARANGHGVAVRLSFELRKNV